MKISVEDNRIPLGMKIKYKIDNFMSKGGSSIFLALFGLITFVIITMAILRFVGNFFYPDDPELQMSSFMNQLWTSFVQISDSGAIENDNDSNFVNKTLGMLSIYLGMILFSGMIAFITQLFSEKIESLRKGKSVVLEDGYTLILGFNPRILEIIRELVIANESERDAAIVVLSETDKEQMDDFFLENMKDRKTTRIVTRQGRISNPQYLKLNGAARAKSVIILNGAGEADHIDEKTLADSRVIKSIMALKATIGDSLPPIVTHLHLERNRKLATGISPGDIFVIDEHQLLAKLLVQTSRTPGLSFVYSDLVGFEGNEMYFHRPESGWKGLTFRQIQFHFLESVPLGFRHPEKGLLINPLPDYTPGDDEEAIILAEDDSTINFHENAVYTPNRHEYSNIKKQSEIEKQLLIGWNPKNPIIIEEYASYFSKGSHIDVVIQDPLPSILTKFHEIQNKFADIQMSLIVKASFDENVLLQLKPEEYNNVIILASSGNDAEEVDAETITILLEFRQYFQKLEKMTNTPTKTQLITEVMDSDNIELVMNAGVRDFLISNQFVSKIISQISEEPEIKNVYDSLFQGEGSEMYLKTADLYLKNLPATLTFGDIMLAASERQEVCFGIRILSEADGSDPNQGIHLIPARTEMFTLTASDLLITLAEDET